MRGYKGMTKNMTCRNMQFEIGKSYYVDGEIKLCKNGLHFCQKLPDVFNYYQKDDVIGNRFFEVETNKPVLTDGVKSVTAELTILRELSDIEVNRAYYGGEWCDNYGNGHGNGDYNGYFNNYDDDEGHGNGYGYDYGYSRSHIYGNGSDDDSYDNGDGDGIGYYNIQNILTFNN